MFGNKKLEGEIFDLRVQIAELITDVNVLHKMVIDLKVETIRNRSAIFKDKNPTVEVIKKRKKGRTPIRKREATPKVSKEEKAEFIRLFDQGLSYTEISGMTGRSASAISNYIYKERGTEDGQEHKTKIKE